MGDVEQVAAGLAQLSTAPNTESRDASPDPNTGAVRLGGPAGMVAARSESDADDSEGGEDGDAELLRLLTKADRFKQGRANSSDSDDDTSGPSASAARQSEKERTIRNAIPSELAAMGDNIQLSDARRTRRDRNVVDNLIRKFGLPLYADEEDILKRVEDRNDVRDALGLPHTTSRFEIERLGSRAKIQCLDAKDVNYWKQGIRDLVGQSVSSLV
jgi:hypothetical protein